MGSSFLIVGSVIAIAGLVVFLGIRQQMISVLQATAIMFVISGISGAVMELGNDSSNEIGNDHLGNTTPSRCPIASRVR
jgi:hypothetical protein